LSILTGAYPALSSYVGCNKKPYRLQLSLVINYLFAGISVY